MTIELTEYPDLESLKAEIEQLRDHVQMLRDCLCDYWEPTGEQLSVRPLSDSLYWYLKNQWRL